jgi:hypothetical protein
MPARQGRHSRPNWRKSSASGSSADCVEVARTRASVLVRDSGNASGAVLTFTPAQWSAFMKRVRRDG